MPKRQVAGPSPRVGKSFQAALCHLQFLAYSALLRGTSMVAPQVQAPGRQLSPRCLLCE